MDPFTAVAAAVGIATTIYGMVEGNDHADKASEALQMKAQYDQKVYAEQANIIRAQQGIEAQRNKAMELDSLRKKREMARNAVAARSQAMAAAVGSGSEGGSVLPGAFGGIAGRTGVNELGVNQNLGIGRNIFGLQSDITAARITGVGFESQSAMYASQAAQEMAYSKQGQATQSMGQSIFSNAPEIGKFTTFASNKIGSSIFSGATNNFSSTASFNG